MLPNHDRKVVAVLSGGLDSTTMVYDYVQSGYDVDCISFNYNQRHKKELEYAARTAKKLQLRHDVVDISAITGFLQGSGSSLITPGRVVPEGHYAEDNMRSTVVPNRNMIMLAIAGGIAVARDAEFLATAVHAGDHAIYPDCRPKFFEPFNWAMYRANEGFGHFDVPNPDDASGPVQTPYIDMSKADIAATAIALGVPLEDTWSCYKGGDIHCGKCGTCVERLEAINEALLVYNDSNFPEYADNTEYADREYWKQVLTK
jgi:7-cyano-7-deazaguanine synthase